VYTETELLRYKPRDNAIAWQISSSAFYRFLFSKALTCGKIN
jgi:hypothetical protein